MAAYYLLRCLNQTILLFIFLSTINIIVRILECIMDTYSYFSNERRPSEGSFPLQSPTWNQEDPYQYAHCNHQGCASALAERRSFMAASNLILPRKRSICSLMSEHVQNAQALDAWSPSPWRPSKRTKEPKTALSPHPQHLRAHEGANDTSRPLVQPSGPTKACVAVQDQEAFNYGSKSAGFRTLSSPIMFKGSLESLATNSEQDSMDHSKLETQSKYLYYPPTNPSEGAHWFSRVRDGGPHRRLSYGAPHNIPGPWVFQKLTNSRHPRRNASLHVKENGCLGLYNQSPEAIQAKPWNPEPSQIKPILWLDRAEDEEIKGMVSFLSLPNQKTCSWLRC